MCKTEGKPVFHYNPIQFDHKGESAVFLRFKLITIQLSLVRSQIPLEQQRSALLTFFFLFIGLCEFIQLTISDFF